MHRLSRTLAGAAAGIGLLSLVSPASAQSLVHRYSFTANANDSVGTANGTPRQLSPGGNPVGSPVTFTGGQAVLDGVGGYIDLPNGIVSTLTNVTIEVWATVNANNNWSRLFDFGTSNVGETSESQTAGTGQQYMFLAATVGTGGTARFAVTDGAAAAERPILTDTGPLGLGVEHHLAVAYGSGVANFYVDGALKASGTQVIPLSAIVDVNNWIGRSAYGADAMLNASINEFRIHSNVLSAAQIKASALASPDTLDYDPGTITAITLTVDANMVAGGLLTPTIVGSFSKIGDVQVKPPDVTITSSATNIVFVNADGTLKGAGIGTATITVKRDTQQATATVTVSPGAPPALKNRYSFSDPAGSTTVVDSVSHQDGSAFGGFSGTNAVLFDGTKANFPLAATYTEGTYISLPPGIISSKTNITIETWITPVSTANWQRVFDIGQSSKADPHFSGGPAAGNNYMFLTVRPGGAGTRLAIRAPGAAGEAPVINGAALSLNAEHHLVSVYAPDYGLTKLYIDGVPIGTGATPFKLNQFVDQFVWLGVSLFNDSPYQGAMNEFRIYEGALTDIDVAVHRSAGPDTLPPDPGALQSVSFDTVPQLLQGQTATRATVFRANFANISNVDITALGPTFVSANTNLFTVSAAGVITVRTNLATGSVNLVGTYQQKSATGVVNVVGPTALRANVTNKLFAAQAPITAALRADFPNNVLDQNVTGFNGVTYSSSDTGVFTVAANGNITTFLPGTATLTATYGGLTVSKVITVEMPANWKRGTLAHRYSFDGTPDSIVVTDSIGHADGTLIGSAGTNFTGTGQLALAGGNNALNAPTGPYVDLPNNLVSTNTAVTLEGWFIVRANTANTRLFDFGMSSGAPDGAGGFLEDFAANPGRSYMFLTPYGGTNPRFAINQGTAGEAPSITSSVGVTLNVLQHYAVVYDPTNGVARLYVNGVRTGTGAATQPLSTVDDRNAWLGRSQWIDPMFNGVFDEFRIYDGPMMDADIAASYAAGPDTVLTTFPSFARLRPLLSGGNIELRWPASLTGFTLEKSSTIGVGASWSTVTQPQTTDGADTKVTVPIGAGSAFYRLRQ
jgi:hypothetical protein